ncbi:esterase/lipase family protein [Scleromatobacter humisilvae]|uniref:Alpha/beta fold hydrolase n=1 Tax=Scleromatobacter humisilvae TaxID=2897159 RepID=A0A9X2C361_9BURK|nr:alpha/beta fold hydrolase [Scleromatobacter humisilvae]MCK9689701.1 alpha/beta fold hydrolase [Scleromatobacter humisilvae]
MLARVARLLFVAWFALLAGLLVAARVTGWTPACWIALYALVLGHPTMLAIELLMARIVARRSAAPRARWIDMVRSVLGEWRESTAIFVWRMPWRSNAIEDHLPKTSRGLRGVVFIHGYICNRGLWNPWMRRLLKLDRAFVAVNLEPLFASLDDYVPQVERAVRRIEAATGLAPVIVAHSMGGLVARAWLRSRATHRRSDGTDEAARLITIGTPHRGTWLARLARTVNGRQMGVDSPWMTTLAGKEPPTLPGLITSWWSECDQVVYPPPTAVYPGSEAKQLRGVGHIAMTAREEVWNEIRRRIDY